MKQSINSPIIDILAQDKKKDGFGLKYHVLVEDFEERHSEITQDWNKARKVFQSSLDAYTTESKALDLKSLPTGNYFDSFAKKVPENHNNLMTPIITNF